MVDIKIGGLLLTLLISTPIGAIARDTPSQGEGRSQQEKDELKRRQDEEKKRLQEAATRQVQALRQQAIEQAKVRLSELELSQQNDRASLEQLRSELKIYDLPLTLHQDFFETINQVVEKSLEWVSISSLYHTSNETIQINLGHWVQNDFLGELTDELTGIKKDFAKTHKIDEQKKLLILGVISQVTKIPEEFNATITSTLGNFDIEGQNIIGPEEIFEQAEDLVSASKSKLQELRKNMPIDVASISTQEATKITLGLDQVETSLETFSLHLKEAQRKWLEYDQYCQNSVSLLQTMAQDSRLKEATQSINSFLTKKIENGKASLFDGIKIQRAIDLLSSLKSEYMDKFKELQITDLENYFSDSKSDYSLLEDIISSETQRSLALEQAVAYWKIKAQDLDTRIEQTSAEITQNKAITN